MVLTHHYHISGKGEEEIVPSDIVISEFKLLCNVAFESIEYMILRTYRESFSSA